ncbi:hypothetical protein F4781DRAFT_434287 [Annulohypoxylon bovei var. microspora]|nr:hypothetical protein F4781DRAFT_434287 [Annulohypoxylon bovei var. microspora]
MYANRFRRLSKLRRKDRNESGLTRLRQSASESQGSSSRSSSISGLVQEEVEPTTVSHISKSAATNTNVQSQKNSEDEAGPLGLTVVYTPENVRKADIVFIHGLGGTSRWTWSKNKDPDLFWPSKFLPLEPDICLARILTFGYNANFRKAGSFSTSILDFAKDLLFDLKYAKDDQKDDLKMGSAYIQGQNDPEYQFIIKAISAIVFLSTPHRGTHLAQTLNRILQSTMVTNPKHYVSELVKNSLTLQKLNEQFRHLAPRLDIISFYETQPTSIGPINFMVLEKDSSILGYPGEISRALDADHHGVCKYDSPKDPNYIAVRNVLKSLLSKAISTSKSKKTSPLNKGELRDLRSLLAITELPIVDYSFFRDQWEPGTCEWVLQDKNFVRWDDAPESTPRALWLSGGPATGKSVLSSFIINNLVERGACCQYFFIRFGDQKKRTLSLLLRSIAFQLAQVIPSFCRNLLELTEEAIDYETASPRTIWERIFKTVLFRMDEELEPLYWVIDGLDEALDPRAVIKLLSDVSHYPVPLRILLTSRKTSEIGSTFEKIKSSLKLNIVTVEGHLEDLSWYVHQELDISGSPDFKENIVKRVVERSQNNFLWVRLAVEKLNLCHRLSDIELAFQELPVGMEALYDRMASSVAHNCSPADKALASSILECTTCSFRELTIAELPHGLDEDISELLDFKRSIVDLCGGFITVDNSGNVTMIHQTAREYLLDVSEHPFHVDPGTAHERMFLSCMKCLMAIGLRAKVNGNQTPEFIGYASSWWSSHLTSTLLDCSKVVGVLKNFLTDDWVLSWIHILSAKNQQRVLIQASKDLSRYCLKQQHYGAEPRDTSTRSVEYELFESWSIDFVKILGKFGMNLRRNPESIYKLVPPFCPRKSSIYQVFGQAEANNIAVSGISTDDWDDSLARMPLGSGSYASSITASGALVGILASPGNVFVYDSSTFEEVTSSPIKHGERVYRMELNNTASLLVTYGYRTIKIWETSTGACKISVDNLESRPRPLSMLFMNNNTTLLIGHDDRRIRSLDLNQEFPTWQLVADLEEPELEGYFLNSSSYMTFNHDGTLIAVAYRGHPLSAFEVDGPTHIGHCWRTREKVAMGDVIDAVWHPYHPELLGLYIEGVIFKWRPYEGETVEMFTGASKLAISRDGNLFTTGDSRGIVKVYTTSDLSLLYQLASQDIVLGLAFSPDNRRFYDIRGYYGNAWEPNALVKFEEQTDKSIDSGNETEGFTHGLQTYSSTSRRVDSITVLAASPAGRVYSYGTERGTVYLFDLRQEKIFNALTPKGFLSIEQMSWSDDGRYVCFSDSAKRVFIISVTVDPNSSELIAETKAEMSMKNITKGPITQLLFRPNSIDIMVFTSNNAHVISLTSFSIVQSAELDTAERIWIVHPQTRELVIGFGPERIQILDWNLVEKRAYTTTLEGSSDDATVEKVTVTQDKTQLLVQKYLRSHNLKERTFHYFEVSKLSIFSEAAPDVGLKNEPAAITPTLLPQDVSSEIALLLSFQSHDSLIFLSRHFSVCSWQVPSGSSASVIVPISRPSSHTDSTNPGVSSVHQESNVTTKHKFKELFSLPGDWISRDCLSLCVVWEKEKSFLCPRNGEVAVVRCAALV